MPVRAVCQHGGMPVRPYACMALFQHGHMLVGMYACGNVHQQAHLPVWPYACMAGCLGPDAWGCMVGMYACADICQHGRMAVWLYGQMPGAGCLQGCMLVQPYACMAVSLGQDVCCTRYLTCQMPVGLMLFFFHGSLANLSDITILYNFKEYDKKFIS